MAKKTLNDVAKGAKAGDGYALDAKQGIKQIDAKAKIVGSGDVRRTTDAQKGIVGAPAETDKERNDGNQDSMGDETLLYGGGYFEREKAGLEDGISIRETMDADKTEPNYNYDIDPLTGNAPERKVGRSNNYDVTGKRGNKFEIGEM
jgi:hypothetical protein